MTRWHILALALIVCVPAAFVVYGPVLGLFYPEYSDFALYFGQGDWYSPAGLGDVVGAYFESWKGWYRPTSFLAVPYLLGLDYFNPGQVQAANIIAFVAVAVGAPLLLRRPRIEPSIVGSLVILMAPSLYLIAYGANIDALYLLFGGLFLASALFLSRAGLTRNRWWVIPAGAIAFFLAITSKEAGLIFAPLLFVALLLDQADISWRTTRRALYWSAPFLVVAGVVYVGLNYFVAGAAEGGVYQRGLTLSKLGQALDLMAWSLGFARSDALYAHWIPAWPSAQSGVAAVMLVVLSAGVLATWRELRLWRIAVYVGTYAGLAIVIGISGGLPHHGFPLVVMYGLAFAIVGNAFVSSRLGRVTPPAVLPVVAALLGILLVANGSMRFRDALERGPHSAFLSASTELFYGSELAAVRSSPNPVLVFQDCLGGLHNPLRVYARSSRGTEIVISTADELRRLAPTIRTARRQGRDVFVAACTGTADPWYRVKYFPPLPPAP